MPAPRTAVLPGLALALVLMGLAAAQPSQAVESDDPLLEARSPEERRCLAEVSRIGVKITSLTGERPEDSAYADGLAEAVAGCRAGRTDDAMDALAEIWAELTLHQRHKS